jgi:hypothetical protein
MIRQAIQTNVGKLSLVTPCIANLPHNLFSAFLFAVSALAAVRNADFEDMALFRLDNR